MASYTYIDRVTGKIGWRGNHPFSLNPDGSVKIRITLANGHQATFSEGCDDGSVRRGVAGQGQQDVLGQKIGAAAVLPTRQSSDWEIL